MKKFQRPKEGFPDLVDCLLNFTGVLDLRNAKSTKEVLAVIRASPLRTSAQWLEHIRHKNNGTDASLENAIRRFPRCFLHIDTLVAKFNAAKSKKQLSEVWAELVPLIFGNDTPLNEFLFSTKEDGKRVLAERREWRERRFIAGWSKTVYNGLYLGQYKLLVTRLSHGLRVLHVSDTSKYDFKEPLGKVWVSRRFVVEALRARQADQRFQDLALAEFRKANGQNEKK